MNFKKLSEEWLDVHSRQVRYSTYYNSKCRLHTLCRIIDKAPVTTTTLNRCLLHRLTIHNVSYRTAEHDYSLLKRIAQFGIDYGYIHNTIHITLPTINKRQKRIDKYLEDDELKQVLKSLAHDPVVHRLCTIQVQTGMRYGELVALSPLDVDLANKTISITKCYNSSVRTFGPTKTGLNRIIHINDETCELIKQQLLYNEARFPIFKHLIFVNRLGNPIHINRVNKLLKKAELNKHVSTHIFRHTFITKMVERGVPIHLIARHVGHNSHKMIENVYLHFSKEMDNQLKKVIDDLYI